MDNKFERELTRIEFSEPTDNKTYLEHSYNGFTGEEGSDAFFEYLDELYNSYRLQLSEETNTMNSKDLKTSLNKRIKEFEATQEQFEERNHLRFEPMLELYEDEMRNGNDNDSLKEEYLIVKFYSQMKNTQQYFITKTIEHLEKLLPTTISTESTIEIQIQEEAPQDISFNDYIDDYFEKYNDKETLTNADLKRIFNISRPTIDKWKALGKFIEISKKGTRPTLYSKEDVKRNIKSGILPSRLTDRKN